MHFIAYGWYWKPRFFILSGSVFPFFITVTTLSGFAQPPGDTSKGSSGRESVDLGPWASVERRDTWDVIWATDDPNQVRNNVYSAFLQR